MQLHADVIVYTVDRSSDPYRAGRWANISLHDKRGVIPVMEAELKIKLLDVGDPTEEIKDAVQLLTQLVAGGALVDIVDGRNAFSSTERVDIPLLGDDPLSSAERPRPAAVPTLPTRNVPQRRGSD